VIKNINAVNNAIKKINRLTALVVSDHVMHQRPTFCSRWWCWWRLYVMETLQPSKRTRFKCTWPGCGREYSTCPAVESHVRLDHLGSVPFLHHLSVLLQCMYCGRSHIEVCITLNMMW